MVDDLAILEAPASGTTGGEIAADTGGDAVSAGIPAAAEPDAAGAPGITPGATPGEPEVVGEQPPAPVELDYPDEENGDEPGPGLAEPAATEAGTQEQAESAGATKWGPSALSRWLKESPELQAAAANPRLKAQLYQMARRSQELAEYQDVLPSLSLARDALSAQEALDGLDAHYYGVDPEQFWTKLHEASGATGAYERQVQFLQHTFLRGLEGRAAERGDTTLNDAVQAIREALGWGNSSKTPDPRAKDGIPHAGSTLPPHIRQQLEELEHLRSRRSIEAQQANEQFLDETAQEARREIEGFVGGILAQANLSEYDKANVTRDFLEQVVQLADQDKVHNAALQEAMAAGALTPHTRAQMIARVKAWTRQNGRDILEPILKRAGTGLRQRQTQRQSATAHARREPAAAGAPGALVQPGARDLVRAAEQKLGRRLSDREILDLA
ncbi:MAG: hypothetical protein ACRD1Y_11205 [Terriglobales bacterium]